MQGGCVGAWTRRSDAKSPARVDETRTGFDGLPIMAMVHLQGLEPWAP